MGGRREAGRRRFLLRRRDGVRVRAGQRGKTAWRESAVLVCEARREGGDSGAREEGNRWADAGRRAAMRRDGVCACVQVGQRGRGVAGEEGPEGQSEQGGAP